MSARFGLDRPQPPRGVGHAGLRMLALLLFLQSGPNAIADAEPNPPAAIERPSATSTTNQVRYPYSGVVAAFDLDRRLVVLAGREKPRVILLTEATRITRGGEPSTLATAKVGEDLAGLCARNPQGQEVAITLRLGPKVEIPPTPPATLKPIRPPKVIEP